MNKIKGGMNLKEGVRRVFLVLQWIAATVVLAIGWASRPHVGENRRLLAKDWKLDPDILRQLNEGLPPPPTWLDWAWHMALVTFSAAAAYFAVFALWKLLHWVGSGFYRRPSA